MNELKEFRDSGLLFLVNQTLHCFGWSIIVVIDSETNEVLRYEPKKVDYFGFKYEDVKKYIENFKKL